MPMRERPDFENIVLLAFMGTTHHVEAVTLARLRESLRQVWNARGAADLEAVEERVRALVAGEVVGAGIARHVAEAVRKLDR